MRTDLPCPGCCWCRAPCKLDSGYWPPHPASSHRGSRDCSVLVWGCTPGGVYGPCIDTHARWVTVSDSGLLLYMCYVFQVLINSLVCWFCTNILGLILFHLGVHKQHQIPFITSLMSDHFCWCRILTVNQRMVCADPLNLSDAEPHSICQKEWVPPVRLDASLV